ncbi:asparaginase [Brevibacillus sp. B_LB10_24]|uniref:asparaginase n=1 Tax=Brevibacillus sp. B_LB10_24 TaxID=3380645 RepID=UPI0038B99F2D
MAETIVVAKRGEYIESRHTGSIAVVDEKGNLLFGIGDVQRLTFSRSSLKPVQAIPLIQSGAADRYLFNDKEIAVCCASHNGEEQHTQVVESILFRLGLGAEHLQCGIHPPYSHESYLTLLKRGGEPTPVHNNCSGKHAGMLALALHLQSDAARYHHADHPVQRKVAEAVSELSGVAGEELQTAIDGCGVPTFALPLDKLAYMYARLSNPASLESNLTRLAVKRITQAMVRYPEMVSGTNEFCTDVMRTCGGKVLAKGGAEGVYCLGLLDRGIGIAIKVEDGTPRASYPAAAEALKQLGVLTPQEEEMLHAYRLPAIKNRRGETVGRLEPVFQLKGVKCTEM